MSHQKLCTVHDLVANSGVCALINKHGSEQQIALFYLPETEQKVFALSNWDPLGKANVLSRGIVGNIGEELVVASPLYKQHFSLVTGQCLEEDTSVATFNVTLNGDDVVMVA